MDVKIDKIYQRADEIYDMFPISGYRPPYEYLEIYAQKEYIHGQQVNVYVLMPKTFFMIIPKHIPKSDGEFILDNRLSSSGVIYNYNSKTNELFLYNCTENHIYIEKDSVIGGVYNG